MAAVYTDRSHMSSSETLVFSSLCSPVEECKSILSFRANVHCQLLGDEAWLELVFYSPCQLTDINY